jgi:hypothetical protein
LAGADAPTRFAGRPVSCRDRALPAGSIEDRIRKRIPGEPVATACIAHHRVKPARIMIIVIFRAMLTYPLIIALLIYPSDV